MERPIQAKSPEPIDEDSLRDSSELSARSRLEYTANKLGPLPLSMASRGCVPRKSENNRFKEGKQEHFHCFFREGEPDTLFKSFTILRKERRRVEDYRAETAQVWADTGYFARRKQVRGMS